MVKHTRAFIGMFLLAGALSSAYPQEQAPPEQVFGESIDVRVVNVEAMVTDGKGKPVRGLTAKDFRLLVDGGEVPIEYFTEVLDGKAMTADTGGAAPPLTAGEAVGRSYLIYIDEAFSLAAVRNAALERLQRDLTLLADADQMAVLAFDGSRIDVLSAWTRDRAALAAALEQARRRPARGNQTLAQQRKLQQDVDWILENADSFEGDQIAAFLNDTSGRISPEARTELGKTAAAAAGALRGFEVPPGRKILLFVSAAWSMGVAPQLYRPMIEAANRLGYTIYPADTAKSDAREVTAFDALARTTGGRAVVSAKMEVFRQVVADTGSYYWLGFTPAWKADDRRHRIAVEPRRPDLTVRARSGFSDLSRRTENAMKAESVILFGGAERDRRLIVQLGEPRRAGRGRVEVPVVIGVPVESLALMPQASGFLAEAPLAVVAMDGRGGRADLPTARLKVELAASPRAGTFARFRTVVKLRDAAQRLVFTVRDPVHETSIWGQAEYAPLQRGR
ncbi:MAG TPA: VWA domain-containing protein [Thermoanaerobaculia bacterium]|jgi:VWFA-related protein|nr:VWA domain-containing protein [Thermoanaerobaculia bacterium]